MIIDARLLPMAVARLLLTCAILTACAEPHETVVSNDSFVTVTDQYRPETDAAQDMMSQDQGPCLTTQQTYPWLLDFLRVMQRNISPRHLAPIWVALVHQVTNEVAHQCTTR